MGVDTKHLHKWPRPAGFADRARVLQHAAQADHPEHPCACRQGAPSLTSLPPICSPSAQMPQQESRLRTSIPRFPFRPLTRMTGTATTVRSQTIPDSSIQPHLRPSHQTTAPVNKAIRETTRYSPLSSDLRDQPAPNTAGDTGTGPSLSRRCARPGRRGNVHASIGDPPAPADKPGH